MFSFFFSGHSSCSAFPDTDIVQMGIQAMEGHQFLVGTGFHNLAVVQYPGILLAFWMVVTAGGQ